jgi:transposase
VAKSYRPVQGDQPFLLPPDMRDWLPADHVVWFLLETVEALDTSAFHSRRRLGGVGAAGYDPDMLLALLIYGYCQGVRSSRQIERRCLTDVAFRYCAPRTRRITRRSRFRAEHQDTFAALFTQCCWSRPGRVWRAWERSRSMAPRFPRTHRWTLIAGRNGWRLRSV